MRCSKLDRVVFAYLKSRIEGARGNVVSIRAGKIARMCYRYDRGLVTKIQLFLDRLVKEGLLTVVKRTQRGVVYALTRDSPLWAALENGKEAELLAGGH